jgi:hypothetical protein
VLAIQLKQPKALVDEQVAQFVEQTKQFMFMFDEGFP